MKTNLIGQNYNSKFNYKKKLCIFVWKFINHLIIQVKFQGRIRIRSVWSGYDKKVRIRPDTDPQQRQIYDVNPPKIQLPNDLIKTYFVVTRCKSFKVMIKA